MLDTKLFLNSVVRSFLHENISFIAKYYPYDERVRLLTEFGINAGVVALAHMSDKESIAPEEGFRNLMLSLLSTWGDSLTVEHVGSEMKLNFPAMTDGDFFGSESLRGSFYLSLSSAVATRFFGDNCASLFSDGNDGGFVISLCFSGEHHYDGYLEMKADSLLGRDVLFMEGVHEKIASLHEKVRALEAEIASQPQSGTEATRRSTDLKLFKLNQELELANIELKSQNTMLVEKNTELAFRLIDLEENLVQAKTSVDNFERKSYEENVKTDEQGESLRKHVAEVEQKLRQSEHYLETAHQELQSRISELDNIKKEHGQCFLAKESAETENLLLKKQLRYSEDMIKNVEREKEGLLAQIQELENLNVQLQDDYINRRSISAKDVGVSSEPDDSKAHFYYKILTVLSEFMGNSAKIMLDKAMSKAGLDMGTIKSGFKGKQKELLLSAIDRAAGIMSVKGEEHALMMKRLNEIK